MLFTCAPRGEELANHPSPSFDEVLTAKARSPARYLGTWRTRELLRCLLVEHAPRPRKFAIEGATPTGNQMRGSNPGALLVLGGLDYLTLCARKLFAGNIRRLPIRRRRRYLKRANVSDVARGTRRLARIGSGI